MPLSAVNQTQVNGMSYSQLINTSAKKIPEKHSSTNLYKENKELFWAGAAAIGLATWAIVSHKNKTQESIDKFANVAKTKIENFGFKDANTKIAELVDKKLIPKDKELLVANLEDKTIKSALNIPAESDANVAFGYMKKSLSEDNFLDYNDMEIVELAKVQKMDEGFDTYLKDNNIIVFKQTNKNVGKGKGPSNTAVQFEMGEMLKLDTENLNNRYGTYINTGKISLSDDLFIFDANNEDVRKNLYIADEVKDNVGYNLVIGRFKGGYGINSGAEKYDNFEIIEVVNTKKIDSSYKKKLDDDYFIRI